MSYYVCECQLYWYFFYNEQVDKDWAPASIFMTNAFGFSVLIGLVAGGSSYLASFYFVKRIYSKAKLDQ